MPEPTISMTRKIYYFIKPLFPAFLEFYVRKKYIGLKRKRHQTDWPVCKLTAKKPAGWKGWPDNKKFALLLTHDVEHTAGREKCRQLANMEKELGFRSAFYFVPERYEVSAELRQYLSANGFEVGVHGLKHDGKLYFSREIFKKRAKKINRYLQEWQAEGFRSPAMHHNLDWIHDLDIQYDLSTFDHDPFEPQPDGVNTIFPFWVNDKSNGKGYVEMPYTLPQDSTLFNYIGEKNISVWKQKVDWLVEQGAMILLIAHPDYMNFDNKNPRDQYPVRLYIELLTYIREKYNGQYWHVLPKELAAQWGKLY